MVRYFSVILLVTLSFALTAFAQTTNTKNRPKLEPTRFQKQHMLQTLGMHVELLKDSDPSKRATVIQNIRDMEYAYPDEPFSDVLTPLMERLKDETETTHVRLLSALALEGLHNDSGDDVIAEVSKKTNNQSVKDLCTALMIRNQNKKD
jgi:hypothetical protein